MGYIKFMGAAVMLALFSVAIMNYVVDFGADNNVAIDLSDDAEVVSVQVSEESDLVTYKSETNSSLKALFDSTIGSGDETSVTGGQFKGGVGGAFSALKNVVDIGNKKIFGSEQGSSGKGIVLTTLISFLGFVLGMYIWKTWAGKNPD